MKVLAAGICGAGFVTIWFWTAYKELSAARNSLLDLEQQIRLHERFYSVIHESVDSGSAVSMLETSHEAAKQYNSILRKPLNLLPSMLMGFRAAEPDHKS